MKSCEGLPRCLLSSTQKDSRVPKGNNALSIIIPLLLISKRIMRGSFDAASERAKVLTSIRRAKSTFPKMIAITAIEKPIIPTAQYQSEFFS